MSADRPEPAQEITSGYRQLGDKKVSERVPVLWQLPSDPAEAKAKILEALSSIMGEELHPHVAVPTDQLNLQEAGFKKSRLAFPLAHEKWFPETWRAGELHAHSIPGYYLVHRDAHGLGDTIKHVRYDLLPALRQRLRGEQPQLVKDAGVALIPEPSQAKAVLEPGDVLVTTQKRPPLWHAPLARVSKIWQGTEYDHAAIYLGGGRVGSMGLKFENMPLKDFHDRYDYRAYRVKAPAAERKAAADWARKQVGKKSFSPLGILQQLVPSTMEMPPEEARRAKAMICSALVAAAYTKRSFGGRPALAVRPVDFQRGDQTKLVAKTAAHVRPGGAWGEKTAATIQQLEQGVARLPGVLASQHPAVQALGAMVLPTKRQLKGRGQKVMMGMQRKLLGPEVFDSIQASMKDLEHPSLRGTILHSGDVGTYLHPTAPTQVRKDLGTVALMHEALERKGTPGQGLHTLGVELTDFNLINRLRGGPREDAVRQSMLELRAPEYQHLREQLVQRFADPRAAEFVSEGARIPKAMRRAYAREMRPYTHTTIPEASGITQAQGRVLGPRHLAAQLQNALTVKLGALAGGGKRKLQDHINPRYDDLKRLGPISRVPMSKLKEIVEQNKKLMRLTDKTAGVYVKKYVGVHVDVPADMRAHVAPDAVKYREEKFGRQHHVTLLRPEEVERLKKKGYTPGYIKQVFDSIPTSTMTVGREPMVFDTPRRLYDVLLVSWPDAQRAREQLGLRPAKLHVTVGATEKKVGDVRYNMKFPKAEHKELQGRLEQDKPIFTTRVQKERGKYLPGMTVKAPWGTELKVVGVQHVSKLKDHPFYEELSPAQKRQLAGRKMDVVKLEKAAAMLLRLARARRAGG